MKQIISNFKTIPEKQNLKKTFGFCKFGSPSKELIEWSKEHFIEIVEDGKFTNYYPSNKTNLFEAFEIPKKFQYMDGFSPNLNKHLHLGHFSNLIFGKCFQSLGVAEKTVSIFGDTLEGVVKKEDALQSFKELTTLLNYKVDEENFASEQKIPYEMLIDGKDFNHKSIKKDEKGNLIEEIKSFEGSLGFDVNGKFIVGIKGDKSKNVGDSSYFCQDVAFAKSLNDSTLYLTGSEQTEHFKDLKVLFPNIVHLPLGLVLIKDKDENGNLVVKKMSSREGIIIDLKDILNQIANKFEGNLELAYNVIAGHFLKSSPSIEKVLDLSTIDNPLLSTGLYFSYTLAKLQSAGCELNVVELKEHSLIFALLASQHSLAPQILFEACYKLTKEISKLYETHYIKDNPTNKQMFEELGNQVLTGLNCLGFFKISKV